MYKKILVLITIVIFSTCSIQKKRPRETWIEKPVSEWPDIVMTNSIEFTDKTYEKIANSFFVDTGADTLAITCKHLFLVFQEIGLEKIDLGEKFVSWKIYPKLQPDKAIQIQRLLNANRKESIGEFRNLKDRDWLILQPAKLDTGIYPLKIRFEAVRKHEVVYALGWAKDQNTERPSLIKLMCHKNMGSFFYTETLTKNVSPKGRSGSPVIDQNGYLVGIVSGAEGNLGVIGAVRSLQKVLDSYSLGYSENNL